MVKIIWTQLAKFGCTSTIILFSYVMTFSACSHADPIVQWNEEVKLNDGRIIVVGEKKRIGGIIARETWMTINLPEFSSKPIVWHENLWPIVVNIDQSRLYIVGVPPTKVEFNFYGKPRPDYVGFIWDEDKWTRIPFEKIPESIYKTNMLLEGVPPNGITLLTLEKKNSKEVNDAIGMPLYLKKIDPKSFFNE